MSNYLNDPARSIKYVSAPCGSGKTYSTCVYIKKNLNSANYLYVAPSKVLVKQTEEELNKLGINPKVITSDGYEGRVKVEIMDFLSLVIALPISAVPP